MRRSSTGRSGATSLPRGRPGQRQGHVAIRGGVPRPVERRLGRLLSRPHRRCSWRSQPLAPLPRSRRWRRSSSPRTADERADCRHARSVAGLRIRELHAYDDDHERGPSVRTRPRPRSSPAKSFEPTRRSMPTPTWRPSSVGASAHWPRTHSPWATARGSRRTRHGRERDHGRHRRHRLSDQLQARRSENRLQDAAAGVSAHRLLADRRRRLRRAGALADSSGALVLPSLQFDPPSLFGRPVLVSRPARAWQRTPSHSSW